MYDWYLLTYEPLNRAKPSIHYQIRDQLSTSVQFSFTYVPQLFIINFQSNKPALFGSVFFLHPPFYMVFTKSTSCHRTQDSLVESHQVMWLHICTLSCFHCTLSRTVFVPSPCFYCPSHIYSSLLCFPKYSILTISPVRLISFSFLPLVPIILVHSLPSFWITPLTFLELRNWNVFYLFVFVGGRDVYMWVYMYVCSNMEARAQPKFSFNRNHLSHFLSQGLSLT